MYWCNLILQALMKRKLGKVGASMYCRSRRTETGQDLPDAGVPGFFALDDSVGEANRSLIGETQSLTTPK
jgi:hypothetical protein